jgi:hypothetical protein
MRIPLGRTARTQGLLRSPIKLVAGVAVWGTGFGRVDATAPEEVRQRLNGQGEILLGWAWRQQRPAPAAGVHGIHGTLLAVARRVVPVARGHLGVWSAEPAWGADEDPIAGVVQGRQDPAFVRTGGSAGHLAPLKGGRDERGRRRRETRTVWHDQAGKRSGPAQVSDATRGLGGLRPQKKRCRGSKGEAACSGTAEEREGGQEHGRQARPSLSAFHGATPPNFALPNLTPRGGFSGSGGCRCGGGLGRSRPPLVAGFAVLGCARRAREHRDSPGRPEHVEERVLTGITRDLAPCLWIGAPRDPRTHRSRTPAQVHEFPHPQQVAGRRWEARFQAGRHAQSRRMRHRWDGRFQRRTRRCPDAAGAIEARRGTAESNGRSWMLQCRIQHRASGRSGPQAVSKLARAAMCERGDEARPRLPDGVAPSASPPISSGSRPTSGGYRPARSSA